VPLTHCVIFPPANSNNHALDLLPQGTVRSLASSTAGAGPALMAATRYYGMPQLTAGMWIGVVPSSNYQIMAPGNEKRARGEQGKDGKKQGHHEHARIAAGLTVEGELHSGVGTIAKIKCKTSSSAIVTLL